MKLSFSDCHIVQENGSSAQGMTVSYNKEQQGYSFVLENHSCKPQKIKEVILYHGSMPFPGQTTFYGEGYSKLSLYAGTVTNPRNITKYADAQHYKLPQKDGFFTVYHMIRFFHDQQYTLLGFCSCRRFVGEIRFNERTLEIALQLENIEIAAGESCVLEEFFCGCHENQAVLMAQFASKIQASHPKLPLPERPTGWCSWQWFGPRVTETDIVNNMHAIQERLPNLKYIQIDDGYQAAMGDWLSECDSFTDVKQLLLDIQEQGFEPAIWVAPFIAEEKSQLFQQHPDWFVQDEAGQPLPSDRYSFGGWRCGPWYMLDGSHPEAQAYLTHVFRTMRQKWHCKYFKLDANMWGAMPFGRRYDVTATCVEAYRQGMQAVLEGAGEDSVILGCNAPMWPSLGVVNSMRVTNDIARNWNLIKELAHTGFYRSWQNGTLWMNDPDCLILENNQIRIVAPDGQLFENKTDVTENEFHFHAAYILACGGFVLLGDDVSAISQPHLDMIQKILAFHGPAAQFMDDSHRVGKIPTDSGMLLFLFNFDNAPQTIDVSLDGAYQTLDFWTEQQEGLQEDAISLVLPPHSAKVLVCTKV